ncbi:MAG: stage II sporulation protein M [Candidatus Aminicenantaceae bacterium]
MKDIKQLYCEEWNRFKASHLKIFLLALLLFILVAVLSYTYLLGHPDLTEQKFLELAEKLLEKVPVDKGRLVMSAAILMSNLVAVSLVVGMGLVPFMFLPALGVILNGAAMGVMSAFMTLRGVDLGSLLLFGLAPHGIIEIPTFLYACTLGIALCLGLTRFIIKELFGRGNPAAPPSPGAKGSEESFTDLLKHTFRTFVLVIVPLILLAAVIEAFITPLLIHAFIGDLHLL